MKITQREMTLGVATLAVLLIGGSWYAATGKVAEWKAMKPEMARLRNEIVRHEAAIKMQDNWKEELDELQQKLEVYEAGSRSVSPELMKIINSISDKHELEITRTNPYAEKPTDDLFELGINCTWTGTIDALVGFLSDLQHQGIRYDIRTLNIQPKGKNTGELKGNMIIDCAYTRKAES